MENISIKTFVVNNDVLICASSIDPSTINIYIDDRLICKNLSPISVLVTDLTVGEHLIYAKTTTKNKSEIIPIKINCEKETKSYINLLADNINLSYGMKLNLFVNKNFDKELVQLFDNDCLIGEITENLILTPNSGNHCYKCISGLVISNEINIRVDKEKIILNSFPNDVSSYYGKATLITSEFNGHNVGGKFIILIDDEKKDEVEITQKSMMVRIGQLLLGIHKIQIKYLGDLNHLPEQTSFTVEIKQNKFGTSLSSSTKGIDPRTAIQKFVTYGKI